MYLGTWCTVTDCWYQWTNAPCLACWALFGSLVPAVCNRTSFAQVHEVLQSHCGDNREGTLFAWLHMYIHVCMYIYYIYIYIYYIIYVLYIYIYNHAVATITLWKWFLALISSWQMRNYRPSGTWTNSTHWLIENKLLTPLF